MLNTEQQALVDRVFPECRKPITQFLQDRAKVFIVRQNETGPDVPPWAIAVESQPDYWIDCKKTKLEATQYARSLGLVVVPRKKK